VSRGRGFPEEDFNMNFAWSATAAAILSFVIGFVVHGMLLAPDYANPQKHVGIVVAWIQSRGQRTAPA